MRIIRAHETETTTQGETKMTATIEMKAGSRTTKTTGPVEYCKAIFCDEPKVLETLAWAISTREEAFGRIGSIEVTATVSE